MSLHYQAWIQGLINLIEFKYYEPSSLVVSVLRDECIIMLNYGGSNCVGIHMHVIGG